jgi:uracil-DNA glycosylase family 4
MTKNKCFKCDLHFNRIHQLSGIGNINADIAFLFDAPRAYESKKGISFSNRKYTEMFNELAKIGIDKDNAYFTYLLKCPTNQSSAEYYRNLEVQVHHCSTNNLELSNLPNLKLVIAMGKFVCNYITNSYDIKYNTYFFSNRYLIYLFKHPFLEQNEDDYNKLYNIYKRYVNPFHIIV